MMNFESGQIGDGKIGFVGNRDEIKDRRGKHTKTLDLQSRTMTPGFIEGQGHILSLGRAKRRLDLSNVKNYDELVDAD
jgi:hypothetical protein